MAKLPPEEIAKIAIAAGIPRNDATVAVAIALAESGGNTHAHNTTPPDNSYGLWQINMYGKLGPDRRRKYGLGSNDELFTPSVNARVMASLSSGGKNWTPWTTYTRGTYLRFLAEANKAVPDAKGPPIPTPPGFDNLSKAIKTLTSKETWIRVTYFGLAVLLFYIALSKLVGDNKINESTKSALKFIGGSAVGRKVGA